MRFSDYLQFLHKYLGTEKTQADFIVYISDLFVREPKTDAEYTADDQDSFNPLSGGTRKLDKIYSGEGGYKLTRRDAKKLRVLFDDSKFIEEIRTLGDKPVAKLIDELMLMGVSANKDSYPHVCADIYYSFLDCLSDNIDEIAELSAIKKGPDEGGLAGTQNDNTIKRSKSRGNEEIQLAAKAFYKKHEKEIALLPLCVMAEELYPLRGNSREIYNDYALQSKAVRREIRKITKCDEIIVKDGWMQAAIERFDDTLFKLGLTTKSFLYDGGKYLYRAIDLYGNESFDWFDPEVFRSHHKLPMYKSGGDWHVALSRYVSEFLYDRVPGGEYIPPWDGLWEVFDLANAPQDLMTNMVCSFVIIVCKLLIPTDRDQYGMIHRIIDYEWLLQRQEDLFYYAALCLYVLYYCGDLKKAEE